MKIYNHKISVKLLRFVWLFFWVLFFRFTPPFFFNVWRVFILKLFGAKITWSSKVYPSAKIFKPWLLEMGQNSCLGRNVDCYNYDKIKIDSNSIISQNTFLCTASHNYNSKKFELMIDQIIIKKNVWVAANCFIGPGVTMNDNSVLLAMSNLTTDTKKNYVYTGNPAKTKKMRRI